MNQSNLVCVGTIGKPRGLRGEFFLNSFCNPTENIIAYKSLIKVENNNDFKIEYIKRTNKKFLSKIENISDLDEIKLLTNKKLYIKNSELPKLSEKEIYWYELIGMNVLVHKTNHHLGVVKEMNNFGSDDCLVIVSSKESIDNKDRLIPFIKDRFIIEIDKANKVIYVDWQKDF
tara:strand:+ start:89 stop:610 length:522 start_codon:yes stop_codon:yes gene_type:complete